MEPIKRVRSEDPVLELSQSVEEPKSVPESDRQSESTGDGGVAAGKKRRSRGEAGTFARRPLPKTAPALPRFIAIRGVFNDNVRERIKGMGANPSEWEDLSLKLCRDGRQRIYNIYIYVCTIYI